MAPEQLYPGGRRSLEAWLGSEPAAEAERHPMLTYLARLRLSGRRTQAAALDTWPGR